MTTVVNLKFEECDVKIGRPTIYGNPYKIGVHGNRKQVIMLFREYFETRIQSDKKYYQAVKNLKGKKLGCHCKPHACHGDVYVKWLKKEFGEEA